MPKKHVATIKDCSNEHASHKTAVSPAVVKNCALAARRDLVQLFWRVGALLVGLIQHVAIVGPHHLSQARRTPLPVLDGFERAIAHRRQRPHLELDGAL